MNGFAYFELATGDVEKAAALYRLAFGWQIKKWDGPIDYWLINFGDQSAPAPMPA